MWARIHVTLVFTNISPPYIFDRPILVTPNALCFKMPRWEEMLPEIMETLERTRGELQIDPKYYEERMRWFAEQEETARRNDLARALEAGFTCIEEYDGARRKEEEERVAIARKRVEEETGKTWEEYWATHPQRAETPPEPFPGCDCEGLSNNAAGVNLMLIKI